MLRLRSEAHGGTFRTARARVLAVGACGMPSQADEKGAGVVSFDYFLDVVAEARPVRRFIRDILEFAAKRPISSVCGYVIEDRLDMR